MSNVTTKTKGHFEITCANGQTISDRPAKTYSELIVDLMRNIKKNPNFLDEVKEIKWASDQE